MSWRAERKEMLLACLSIKPVHAPTVHAPRSQPIASLQVPVQQQNSSITDIFVRLSLSSQVECENDSSGGKINRERGDV
jgi:hypothetical protein